MDDTATPGPDDDRTEELSVPIEGGDDADVAALVAERDQLRAEVDELSAQPRPSRWTNRLRRLTAGAMVFLFALSFLDAGVGIWLRRTTLNNDVWEERVVPIGEDPAVQQALATYTTDQLMTTIDPQTYIEDALPERASILAVPLASAVRTYVGDKVDAFFASDRFEQLWRAAAIKSHAEAVALLRGEKTNITATDDSIQINLIPIIDEVLATITKEAPGLVGSDATLPDVTVEDVPDAARERLSKALGVDLDDDFGTLTIYDGGTLKSAQDAVALLDRLVILSLVLTVLFPALALWISPNKRRTLLQLLAAAGIMCIVLRRVLFLLQDQVLDRVKPENQDAADVVLSNLIDPLTSAAATVLWVVGLAGLAVLLSGPYPWAVSLRARVAGTATTLAGAAGDKARDPGTSDWIVLHADALRIGGYVGGVLLLWFVNLSWFTFLLIAALVAGWQIAINRIAPREDDSDTPTPDAGLGTGPGAAQPAP
jgi:hypothetical protein